jgi:DTW domain-containing protein YfiP
MRDFCFNCRKARVTCYCAQIQPFETAPLFVILVHPREARNSIGTGRMLHRSLTNSLFIEGGDFEKNEAVNKLIESPAHHGVVLYPGRESLNLSGCSAAEFKNAIPMEKRLVIFIIDGTWGLA